jgi:hypothetical protein
MREQDAFYYPNSAWQLPFVGGYRFLAQPGVLNLDGYIMYYWAATGVTPAMEEKMVGQGSQYAWAARDANGQPLDGGRNYRLHLPPNIPIKEFWSVIVYTDQTRSMIQTDQQFPSVSSQTQGLLVNTDGSVAQTGPWTSISGPSPRRARKRTGCRQFPATGGTPSCASTARSNPGSTRLGGPERSSCSHDRAYKVPPIRRV